MGFLKRKYKSETNLLQNSNLSIISYSKLGKKNCKKKCAVQVLPTLLFQSFEVKLPYQNVLICPFGPKKLSSQSWEHCQEVLISRKIGVIIISIFQSKISHFFSSSSAGLFDSLGTSEEGGTLQWSNSDELDCPSDNSFDRKVSPPFLEVLSESRTRSGSDPSISLEGSKKKAEQQHRKSSQENASSSPKSGKTINISRGQQKCRIFLVFEGFLK